MVASNSLSHHTKAALDWIAGFFTVAGAMSFVNILLALPAALYMCCRIYEWFEKRRSPNVPRNKEDE